MVKKMIVLKKGVDDKAIDTLIRILDMEEEDIQKYFRKLPSKEKLNFIKNFGT